MPVIKSSNAGNSSAEEKFVQLFCDVFGAEKGEFVYLQHPFVDIYGNHRTIDFAIRTSDSRIAFEIDGETWHNPGKISQDKYTDDLLKQNSLVHEGWKVFRWTDIQLQKTPERVKDELITFLGYSPALTYIDTDLPGQKGAVFELREHQEEALANLLKMKEEGKTIALVQGATGSGKSAIGVIDAKRSGGRTLFLAHTKELVEQGAKNFENLWGTVSVGRFYEDYHDTDTHVVCGSIQSITRNLDLFKPDDFDYLIIDECHHASAKSYISILSYFKPGFTLGLTATPERADGEDLLEVFQNVAHKLDIKEAVETGVLCPVRCIRVKTNINMNDVRISGFKYNSLDLEETIMIPDRNNLIVNTYLEYVNGKSTVIFCTSVNHADTIASMLQDKGVRAESVSGGTKPHIRKQILKDYAEKKTQVLCACDLLNEGWDSPITEVLFMARPTMSKTIYMQQLGRGMRTHEGKNFLMVFDFVDNANMFNCPYSLHRILNLSEYVPGGMVLGTKHGIAWDNDMFRKGEKPSVLVDFPVHTMDYEIIDLFNWQDKASRMYSQMELVRHVSVQEETINKYIKDGKIIPDMDVPISEHKILHYFERKRVKEYCEKFGWTEITASNRKKLFLDFCKKMNMSYSYKPVFLISFLSCMNENGEAELDDIADSFAQYYEDRLKQGLPAEKKNCIFTRGSYTAKDVETLILSNPFRRFEDMGYMHHSKYLGILQIDKSIMKSFDENDLSELLTYCGEALDRYWK
ncbi:MAG: DEAD/DEAH box helicase [Ruminococcus sp.]|nr:DEAD/DEAH box helicase [Ruminococcus sp.]